MLLSVLLMLLMLSGAQAGFLGQVSSVLVSDIQGGEYEVISQEKTSFSSCVESGFQYCQPVNGCYLVDESSGEWCQKENIELVTNRLLLGTSATTSNWVENINNITTGRRVVYYEQRNRSDIGKPNSAPQTTIIPILRVPSNCQKNITLLTFDSNGDEVKCRYAAGSQSECVECTPPSVLGISPSCSLSFNSTNSSAEGSYVVQMIMEDFPRQTITLFNFSGSPQIKTINDFISKTSIQFLVKVVPAVPSCTEGLILPTFLPPTPDHRTRINATVNQMLEIPIRAEATRSMITMLLFSGPPSVVRSSAGPGNYSLTWTPSNSDYGRSHPICFIVQANYSGSVYHSDLRCLVVTVGNNVIALNAKISTTLSLVNDHETIVKQLKDKLIDLGLPSTIIVRVLNNTQVAVTTRGS